MWYWNGSIIIIMALKINLLQIVLNNCSIKTNIHEINRDLLHCLRFPWSILWFPFVSYLFLLLLGIRFANALRQCRECTIVSLKNYEKLSEEINDQWINCASSDTDERLHSLLHCITPHFHINMYHEYMLSESAPILWSSI